MAATVRTIAHFLGRNLSNDDVKRIVEHCQVDKMRNNDKVSMSYWSDIRHVDDSSEGRFINKGTLQEHINSYSLF